MIAGLDPFSESIEAIKKWFVRVNIVYICFLWHIHAKSMKEGVNYEATKSFALKISGGTHGGGEDIACLAGRPLVLASPCDGHGWIIDTTTLLSLPGRWIGVRFHVFQDKAAHEDGGILGRIGLIDVTVSKDISHSLEDRVVLGGRFNHTPASLFLMMPPVANPFFTKNALTKTTEFAPEGVRACTKTEHGDAAVAGVIEMLVVRVIPCAESKKHDNGIG